VEHEKAIFRKTKKIAFSWCRGKVIFRKPKKWLFRGSLQKRIFETEKVAFSLRP